MTRRVLEENGDESLDRTEGSTVDHHRAVTASVGPDVLEVEAFGKVVVDLDRAELPAAADGVLDHEVELGAIERGLAGLDDVGKALFLRGLDDTVLGPLPILVGTDVFLTVLGVAEGDLGSELVEIEGLEDVEDKVDDLLELLLELVRAAEKVSVVLREAADSREAVELAALLIAVDRAELRETERKVAVRTRGAAVDLASPSCGVLIGWNESLPYLA